MLYTMLINASNINITFPLLLYLCSKGRHQPNEHGVEDVFHL